MKEYYILPMEPQSNPKLNKFVSIWIKVVFSLAAIAFCIDFLFPMIGGEKPDAGSSVAINFWNMLLLGAWLIFQDKYINKRTPFIHYDGKILSIRRSIFTKVFTINTYEIKEVYLKTIKFCIIDVYGNKRIFELGDYSYLQIQLVKELIQVLNEEIEKKKGQGQEVAVEMNS